ncbi:MAG: sterol desaturase family protein [Saprospiraceae bacterium]|nr:sterol desaturase family protein [Saprospiraceae bacterium]
MHINLLALSVPFFLVFILLEFWIARRQGKDYFSFAQSVSNLNVGIVERLSDAFVTGSFYFVYDYLYRHFAVWHIEPSWYSWILLLVVTDFVWYWYHRLGHEVNLLWGLHIVHHQSPEFNFTASTRITVFQAAVRTCFWSVLPILGFPAPMITSILIIHGVYPFFTHTRLVGKLGWLEYVFVTPSHHRVHHASNEQYLDKNYGDVFIFWDKLFGTFKEEKEEPVYGLTKPLNSYSFLWQHFHFLLEMAYAMRKTNDFGQKWRILVGSPDMIDPRYREILERKYRMYNSSKPAPARLNRYVMGQIAFTLALLFVFLCVEALCSAEVKWLIAGFILITVINCGAILERRRWIFHVEMIRAALIATGLVVYLPAMPVFVLVGLFFVLSVHQYDTLEAGYFRLVYRRA